MRHGSPALVALTALAVAGGAVQAASAATPKAEVRGVSNSDLRQRIQQAVGEARTSAKNRLEARRRAEDAAGNAALALRSEGYYDYTITPDVTHDKPPKGVLNIDPGPQFKLAAPAIEWVGASPDETAAAEAVKAIDLLPGEAGRAPDVVAAEGRILAVLKKRGYADAKAEPRRVVADFSNFTLAPTYRIASGALVRLDGVRLVTKGHTKQSWVARLAPWREGQVYRPGSVAELERRLSDTGVYQSVSVALAPVSSTKPDGLRPVEVTLVDRAPVNVQLGGSYSTAEGVGVDSAVRFYNRLGKADTISLIARVAEIEKLIGVQLSLPHVGRPDQTLEIEPDVYGETTDAFDSAGQRLRIDLKRRLRRTSWLTYGVVADEMRDKEYAIGPGPHSTIRVTRDLTVVSGFVNLTFDRSDHPLNPTHGWKVTADVAPTMITGDRGLSFVRASSQASAYLPFDVQGNTVLAGRLRLGSILSATVPDVPAPERFFSGGGGSVRGYRYQGIGPHFPNGAPEGGAGLFETSLELRRTLFGKWGAVAFVDGGSLSRTPSPDFTHVEWAIGVGGRYMMGFAPLRVDVAFPLDHSGGNPSLQVYLGLGQAF